MGKSLNINYKICVTQSVDISSELGENTTPIDLCQIHICKMISTCQWKLIQKYSSEERNASGTLLFWPVSVSFVHKWNFCNNGKFGTVNSRLALPGGQSNKILTSTSTQTAMTINTNLYCINKWSLDIKTVIWIEDDVHMYKPTHIK